ncbi:MAG: CARDB domain-containing protein [Owenweeksia sp.]|nr:CARDB domain-containing protein [Owenweeksia sp.]
MDQSDRSKDEVFLSMDHQLDGGDMKLTEKYKNGPVSNGQSYTSATGLRIPNGISGKYYLIVDPHITGDTIPANDTTAIPIHISLTPPPDLVVSSFSIPAGNVYAGQQLYIHYTVTNQGVGDIDSNTTWSETFYLNSTPTSGGSGVGSHKVTRALPVGSSYSDSVLVSIPQHALGNYYLVLKTDNFNKIYEHGNEGNNTSAQSWYLYPSSQLQTDLVPSSFSFPDTMLLGYKYYIPHQYQNIRRLQGFGYTAQWLLPGCGYYL